MRGTFSLCSFLWQNAAGTANGAKIYTLWPQQREKYEEKPQNAGVCMLAKSAPPRGGAQWAGPPVLPGGGPCIPIVILSLFHRIVKKLLQTRAPPKYATTQRPAVACGPQRGKPPRCKGGNSRARQLPNAAISPFGVPFDEILRQTAHSSLTLLAHNLPQNFPVCVAAVGACPPAVTILLT